MIQECCVSDLFLGRRNTHPDREPTKDQSRDVTRVQLEETMSFTGVTYRNMGEASLTGAEMTQR